MNVDELIDVVSALCDIIYDLLFANYELERRDELKNRTESLQLKFWDMEEKIMLTEEDKKKLDAVFEAAKKGDPTAYIACMFMTEEQKEYMQTLCDDCLRNS